MTTTTDEGALLAAIAAHPDEDTPRLMYADWLDENDQPERAEFIRLQIALSRESDDTARMQMSGRVWALWLAGIDRQFVIPGGHALILSNVHVHGELTAFVTRGFVGDLYFPRMADVCERAMVKCRACDGTGEYYSLGGPDSHWADCLTCEGRAYTEVEWQFTQTALRLARENPIKRVWVGDVEIYQVGGRWFLRTSAVELLPEIIIGDMDRQSLRAESEARDALAVAIAKAMRKTAGVSE